MPETLRSRMMRFMRLSGIVTCDSDLMPLAQAYASSGMVHNHRRRHENTSILRFARRQNFVELGPPKNGGSSVSDFLQVCRSPFHY